MTLAEINKRYVGIQDVIGKMMWSDCCLFLCLLTIADEQDAKYNLIDVISESRAKEWLAEDFTVRESTRILHLLTGKEYVRDVYSPEEFQKILDAGMSDDWFSIEKWKRVKDNNEVVTHFRRRFCDTLLNSQTVKYGKLVEYYVYKLK